MSTGAWAEAPDPDITVTHDGELMVAGIQGENYDGIEFVDAWAHPEMVVADAGHIVLREDAVGVFIEAARFDGFIVAEVRQ